MALHTKKLYYRRAGVTNPIDLYTSTADVGAEYISLRVDGITVYAPIVSVADPNASFAALQHGGVTKRLGKTTGPSVLNFTQIGAGTIAGDPYGLSMDSGGNMFVSLPNQFSVAKYTSALALEKTIFIASSSYNHSCVIDWSDNLAVGLAQYQHMRLYGPSPNYPLIRTSAGVGYYNHGIAADKVNQWYYASGTGGTIQRYSSTFGYLTQVSMPGVYSCYVDSSSNVYGTTTGTVRKWNSALVEQPSFAIPGGAGCFNVTTDSLGNAYVTSGTNIHKYTSGGSLIGTFTLANAHFTGICVDSSFNIYVNEYNSRRLIKYSQS